MIRLLGSQPLKHSPAAPILRFLGSVCIKRIAPAFNGEREFKRVADDSGLEAPLLVESFESPLLPEAGLTDPEDQITAVALVEAVFIGDLPNEVFDTPRGKLDGRPARVAYEM